MKLQKLVLLISWKEAVISITLLCGRDGNSVGIWTANELLIGSKNVIPVDDSEQHRPIPIPTRAPSTTIDELEREFQRKKQRELDMARAASSGSSSNGNTPRLTGEKVGRNDPCPCGSGKKFKKCHGAEA